MLPALSPMVSSSANAKIIHSESELRQRVSHKLKLCPEEYLPIIEGAIDGAISLDENSVR